MGRTGGAGRQGRARVRNCRGVWLDHLPQQPPTHRMVGDHLVHKVDALGDGDLHATPSTLCGWEQLVQPGSLPVHPSSTPPAPPALPLSKGITPSCSMVFRGAWSGISCRWRTQGGKGAWLASATHPIPSPSPPPFRTHSQGLQGRLVRVDSESAGET